MHRAIAESRGQGTHLSITPSKRKSARAPPYIPGSHKATSLQKVSLTLANKPDGNLGYIWTTRFQSILLLVQQFYSDSATLHISNYLCKEAHVPEINISVREEPARGYGLGQRGTCSWWWQCHGPPWQFSSRKQSKAALHMGLALLSSIRDSSELEMKEKK